MKKPNYFKKALPTYTVIAACATLITIRKLRGTSDGQTIYISLITMQHSDSDLLLTLKRRQFPERPALSMMINKSQ